MNRCPLSIPTVVAPLALAVAISATARAEAVVERTETETVVRDQPIDRAPREDDSHVRKPFWIDGGLGWQRLDLTTFYVQRVSGSTALTADLAPRIVSGPGANVGLGARFSLLTLGLRLGMTLFDAASSPSVDGTLQLYSIDAELGVRMPIGRVEPYLVLGVGYSVLGGLGDAVSGLGKGLDIDGANGRIGLGLDYFANPYLSFGIRGTAEALFLARRGVSLRDLAAAQSVDTVGEAKARALEGGGSSVGTAFAITAGPGLHF